MNYYTPYPPEYKNSISPNVALSPGPDKGNSLPEKEQYLTGGQARRNRMRGAGWGGGGGWPKGVAKQVCSERKWGGVGERNLSLGCGWLFAWNLSRLKPDKNFV